MESSGEQHLHKELTERIIGLAMLILRNLGPGLNEECYENSLCIEFAEHGLNFSKQTRYPVHYKGHVVGRLIPDLIVGENVVVENKVVDQILDVHVAQVLTYLAVTGLEVGLILNYKHPSLQVRRVVKSRPACSLKKNLR